MKCLKVITVNNGQKCVLFGDFTLHMDSNVHETKNGRHQNISIIIASALYMSIDIYIYVSVYRVSCVRFS